MTPKTTDQPSASRTSVAISSATTTGPKRKPWVKKTPVQVVLDQIDHLRENVFAKEEELKVAKKQLQKLEEARKLLESA